MNRKIFIAGAILLAVALSVPLSIAGFLIRIPLGDQTLVQSPGESVVIAPTAGGQVVLGSPAIHSTADWQAYATRAQERLQQAQDPNQYIATITFSHPLTLEELEAFVQRNGLHPVSVRFASKPEGAGQLAYPVTEVDLAELAQQEAFLKEQFAQAKKDDPSTIVPEDFTLVAGFISITVQDSGKRLKALGDPAVVLVDVGPVDFLSRTGITGPAKDVYFEWSAFGR